MWYRVRFSAVPSSNKTVPVAAKCSPAWKKSSVPREPGNCSAAAFQIHSAPSPDTLGRSNDLDPRRSAHTPQRGPNAATSSMAATANRLVGFGTPRRSHWSGDAGGPHERQAKTPIFMSRQPPKVFTSVAPTWNSVGGIVVPAGAG